MLDAGHDCAVVEGGLALTTDTLVQGVHFDDRLSAEDVGFKAVAVSVSDLAAVGARPAWAQLGLSLPDAPDAEAFVAGLARGLASAAERFGVYLCGGDTTGVPRGGPRYVTVTLGGRCVGSPRSRRGARPGDDLWVTGTLGLAGAGWRLPAPGPAALAALRRPDPPLSFALALAERALATAGMDLSDGLRDDLPRLCAASGVGARISPEALPSHPELDARPDRLSLQVASGEDYQLLFTSGAAHADAVRSLAAAHGVRLTRIGLVTADGGARLDGAAWPDAAFTHFHDGGDA